MTDTKIEVVLNMLFLTLSSDDVSFSEREFNWRSYTTAKVPSTTKRVELIDKKKFAKAVLDTKSDLFVMHVSALEAPLSGMTIYLLRAAQITGGNLM